MGLFKRLRIWNESINLIKEIYLITSEDKFSRDFGLKNQIRRSAVSIASNIAEGDESGYPKKNIAFLNIAKGSAAEVATQIVIAKEVGYLSQEQQQALENATHKIIASIKKYIQTIKHKNNWS